MQKLGAATFNDGTRFGAINYSSEGGSGASHESQVCMHFFFFFFSEYKYLLHLLFLQLFALSAQGGELLGGGLLGGGANGGGASHTSQVFLHFSLFLSEYLLHLLFLHHFALSAHGGKLGGAPVVVVGRTGVGLAQGWQQRTLDFRHWTQRG
jgi:hypothetical protein